jgi:hypothetical protein
MKKQIFILREQTWHWTEDDAFVVGYYNDNQIFDTLAEAIQEKNKRLIAMIRKDGISDRYPSSKHLMEQQVDLYRYLKDKFDLDLHHMLSNIGFDQPIFTTIMRLFVDDDHIIELCEVLGIDILYKVLSFEADDFLYKLEPNPMFTDFLIPEYAPHDGYVVDYLFNRRCYAVRYFDTLEAVQKQLANFLNKELSYGSSLLGTFSELSDAPDLLEAYIKNHACFIYNSTDKTLKISQNYDNYIDNNNTLEALQGLVALLKPNKIPLLLKPYPAKDVDILSPIHEEKWRIHIGELQKKHKMTSEWYLEQLRDEALSEMYENMDTFPPPDLFIDE